MLNLCPNIARFFHFEGAVGGGGVAVVVVCVGGGGGGLWTNIGWVGGIGCVPQTFPEKKVYLDGPITQFIK